MLTFMRLAKIEWMLILTCMRLTKMECMLMLTCMRLTKMEWMLFDYLHDVGRDGLDGDA